MLQVWVRLLLKGEVQFMLKGGFEPLGEYWIVLVISWCLFCWLPQLFL